MIESSAAVELSFVQSVEKALRKIGWNDAPASEFDRPLEEHA